MQGKICVRPIKSQFSKVGDVYQMIENVIMGQALEFPRTHKPSKYLMLRVECTSRQGHRYFHFQVFAGQNLIDGINDLTQ